MGWPGDEGVTDGKASELCQERLEAECMKGWPLSSLALDHLSC